MINEKTPSNIAISIASNIIPQLLLNNIFNFKVENITEGISLIFYSKYNATMYAEIYNDGDMSYLIEDVITEMIVIIQGCETEKELTEKIIEFTNEDNLTE